MASTIFQDYNQNTPIVSAWLNDINNGVYSPNNGVPRVAVDIPVAWVRFSVSGTTVTIQQSSNVASVVRNSAGNYTITYGTVLTNTFNCYQIAQNVAGFSEYTAETAQSVTIQLANTSNVATDPGSCCVVVLGTN